MITNIYCHKNKKIIQKHIGKFKQYEIENDSNQPWWNFLRYDVKKQQTKEQNVDML
jgi:hypothetical protein